MPIKDRANNVYISNIKKAVKALKSKEFQAAQKHIEHAMVENPHAPEVHNLLGIFVEMTGNLSLACKHYRAAYALDPSYKPADRNLKRVTSFYYKDDGRNIDYGDIPEKEEDIPYFVEYDDHHIGHLKKRSKKKNE